MEQSNLEQPSLGPEDITLVRRAAVLAGATVAITRYSGEGGTRDEFRGIIEGLEQAVAKYPNNPLVQALDLRRDAGRGGRPLSAVPARSDTEDVRRF